MTNLGMRVWRSAVQSVWLFAILIAGGIIIGCGKQTADPKSPLGTRINVNNCGFYFTSKITNAEAGQMVGYLRSSGMASNDSSTIQLDRNDSTYVLRIPLKPAFRNDTAMKMGLQLLTTQISDHVLHHDPLTIEICDGDMKVVGTVYSGAGKGLDVNESYVFGTANVSQEEYSTIVAHLKEQHVLDSLSIDLIVDKQNNVFILGTAMDQETMNHPEIADTLDAIPFMDICTNLSHKALHDAPVEFHLFGKGFKVLRIIKPTSKTS